MLRHSCGYKLANDGQDTRAIQHTSATARSRRRCVTPHWRRIASRVSGRTGADQHCIVAFCGAKLARRTKQSETQALLEWSVSRSVPIKVRRHCQPAPRYCYRIYAFRPLVLVPFHGRAMCSEDTADVRRSRPLAEHSTKRLNVRGHCAGGGAAFLHQSVRPLH